jgi:hypothetical protein
MSTHAKRRHPESEYAPMPLGRCARSGKLRWADRAAARRQRRLLKGNGDPRARDLRTYRCADGCGSWHVGHLGAA